MWRLNAFFLFLCVPVGVLAAEPADFLIPNVTTRDVVIDAMFKESIDVAIDSIKTTFDGSRYISAGPRYLFPPRTYYRDSYWTSGLLLFIDPTVVREQILLLAKGVEASGSVPSAIVVDGSNLKIPLWIDHHDSGPYFIMMVYDYLRFTGDQTILDVDVQGRSVYVIMQDILSHLDALDLDGNSLPEKPANSLQDWLDTIPRGGEVLYNEVLYFRAIRNLSEMAELKGDISKAVVFNRQSLIVRYQINAKLWNEKKGYYFERCEKNVCVDRLTNESSLAILYDVIPASKRKRLFLSLKQLEKSWGVVSVIPEYAGFKQNSYQNATDWPVLDGMNVGARLKYGNGNWYHAMTRWWIFFNEHAKAGEKLPEFVSPTDFTAGRSQAWSVNPVVSFLRYGIGLDPELNGSYTIKTSPIGPVALKNVWMRGSRISTQ